MSSTTATQDPIGHSVWHPASQLRVAFLAGTLGQGGAEKQLIYMTRALRQSNVTVRVYSLTSGEFYHSALRSMGVEPIVIGQYDSPLLRLSAFVKGLRAYQPHIVQSGHFFTNLYVTLAARCAGAVPIGTIRSDVLYELERNRWWAPWLFRLPRSMIVNSHAAVGNLKHVGVAERKCHVVPNVIDLAEFDAAGDTAHPVPTPRESPVIVTIARLHQVKRLDRFLDIVSRARETIPGLRGMIIGDGPDRSLLEAAAFERGLIPDGVEFLGHRHDVPVLLRRADIFLLTSEHEGFPNVLLEAMAARLPVLTTAAGDSGRVVVDGVTGYVAAQDDVAGLAERAVQLARSATLRRRFGGAGRQRVERHFSYDRLASRLLDAYRAIARQQRNGRTLKRVSGCL